MEDTTAPAPAKASDPPIHPSGERATLIRLSNKDNKITFTEAEITAGIDIALTTCGYSRNDVLRLQIDGPRGPYKLSLKNIETAKALVEYGLIDIMAESDGDETAFTAQLLDESGRPVDPDKTMRASINSAEFMARRERERERTVRLYYTLPDTYMTYVGTDYDSIVKRAEGLITSSINTAYPDIVEDIGCASMKGRRKTRYIEV